MKTEINSILNEIDAKFTHNDVLERKIHVGDVVAVLDTSYNAKCSMTLTIGIVEKTNAKYLKIIDYKSFFTDERHYVSRAIVGHMCCIINNEIPKYDLDAIKNTFATPFEPFYGYVFAYKITDDFYCLHLILSKGMGTKNTFESALDELKSSYNNDVFLTHIKDKTIENIHILMKDFTFKNVKDVDDYSKIYNDFISPSTTKSSKSIRVLNREPLFCSIDNKDDVTIYEIDCWGHRGSSIFVPKTLSYKNYSAIGMLVVNSEKEFECYKSFIKFVRALNEN